MDGATLIPPAETVSTALVETLRPVDPRNQFTCACGHELYVYGGGRHRVYFPPENDAMDNPIMDGKCPECGRSLPGKQ